MLGAALAASCSHPLPSPESGPDVPLQEPAPAAAEGVSPAPPPPPPPLTTSRPAPPLPAAPEAPTTSTPESGDEGPVEAGPILLRVGLASDLEAAVVPCCEAPLQGVAAGQSWKITAPLHVAPAPGSSRPGSWRLQVAALKDEGQARSLARRLGAELGAEADAHFDASVGLYRVRVGRFADRAAADRELGRLSARGLVDAWVVSEGGGVTDPALLVTQGGRQARAAGRWLAVEPREGGVVIYGGKRYRGRLLVYLNDRGTLNVIDELPLEEYLRGVVPSEMGPALYPRLEALKAQAVAARTYTLRNLGEFAKEGYDICSTPRCQVYGGLGEEHPLSDRAVADTAGQVLLYRGEPIDARYSATCGGHTEDVQVVFPLEDAPYLAGVPCMEAGLSRLQGGAVPPTPFAAAVTARFLPRAPAADRRAEMSARLEHLALLAGLPLPDDHLASLKSGELRRFVTSLFDLALDPRLLARPEALDGLLAEPHREGVDGDRRAPSRAAAGRPSAEALGETVGEAEGEELLLRLARKLGVIVEQEGDYFSSRQDAEGGEISVRTAEGERHLPLAADLATFVRRGGRLVAADLDLAAGDRVRFVEWQGKVIALVRERETSASSLDAAHRFAPWTRTLSRAELARRVEARYPGLGFEGLEVLSRGVSGRVGRLRLLGDDGRSVEVDGLAVRWTLELPDTRFTVTRLHDRSGHRAWRFRGRGWGHGVGLCQVGSYGMAGRGATYRDILMHYYSGVELARVRRVEPRFPSPPEVTAKVTSQGR